MKNQAEKAIILLSLQTSATIDFSSIARNKNLEYILTSDKFLSISDLKFKWFMEFASLMFEHANVNAADLDMILLSGGLSHIPRISKLLK